MYQTYFKKGLGMKNVVQISLLILFMLGLATNYIHAAKDDRAKEWDDKRIATVLQETGKYPALSIDRVVTFLQNTASQKESERIRKLYNDFRYTVANGTLPTVQKLLTGDATQLIDVLPSHGSTYEKSALMSTVSLMWPIPSTLANDRAFAIAQELIHQGADPNDISNDGITPLRTVAAMIDRVTNPVHARYGDDQTIKQNRLNHYIAITTSLLDHGADPLLANAQMDALAIRNAFLIFLKKYMYEKLVIALTVQEVTALPTDLILLIDSYQSSVVNNKQLWSLVYPKTMRMLETDASKKENSMQILPTLQAELNVQTPQNRQAIIAALDAFNQAIGNKENVLSILHTKSMLLNRAPLLKSIMREYFGI
jgi:hypothetical protein